jgi:biotin carboxylase
MSNKARFRVFQREHGLNRPNFVVAQSLQEIEEQISTLSLPVMFKPVDTSGSRGITRVDELGHDLWVTAFEYAQSYSRSKKVCVEELVEGTDVSGDAFLANGRLEFVVITHKYKNGFVPAGHSLPTNISAEDQERVCAEITINCNAIGYNDGPLDFDVRVSPERVTVLEMSPRLGGNGIPMIIARATGVDLIAATLRFALGENVAFPSKCEIFRNCGSWIFGSNHAGRLKAIASAEELRAAVPEVFEYFVNYRVGDEVPQFVHSGNSLGYVLFDCPAHSTYQELINRLKIGLRLEVV